MARRRVRQKAYVQQMYEAARRSMAKEIQAVETARRRLHEDLASDCNATVTDQQIQLHGRIHRALTCIETKLSGVRRQAEEEFMGRMEQWDRTGGAGESGIIWPPPSRKSIACCLDSMSALLDMVSDEWLYVGHLFPSHVSGIWNTTVSQYRFDEALLAPFGYCGMDTLVLVLYKGEEYDDSEFSSEYEQCIDQEPDREMEAGVLSIDCEELCGLRSLSLPLWGDRHGLMRKQRLEQRAAAREAHCTRMQQRVDYKRDPCSLDEATMREMMLNDYPLMEAMFGDPNFDTYSEE
ncbi:hypothetical protein KIPB_005707 [Kipferlia bialata]|uniref:Uncharacterized protein n=1 Tax=Kipferlia bialata TaxID=797122 RepID=A0A9K3GIQ0_9EUKA|nr:hypothetical protein KIPB_005707 [Kipferlia bialata]|eukprot:g5707.t1